MIPRSVNHVLIRTTLLLSLAASAQADHAAVPRIEVCFLLDTTGSMGRLIEGAKLKIWSIANQMVSAQPAPQLKIALVGYRDRGDEYIVRRQDLSADIDTVYGNLQKFQAGGGGDTPESVNQALDEAVNKVGWSADRSVLKIIFLVGDSPPHMDYQDDIKYQATCATAVKRDLIINTVQCGANSETTRIWQEIAALAEGKSVAISQSGDMQVISTPMDKELSELNVSMGRTLTPYGASLTQRAVLAKQIASEVAAAPAAADRLAYNASTGKAVQGGGDLIDDLKGKRITLTQIKKEELPAQMQSMTLEQQRAFVSARLEERQKIQMRINELIRLRQSYIQDQMRRQEGNSSFDEQVRTMIIEQGKKKGIQYRETNTKK